MKKLLTLLLFTVLAVGCSKTPEENKNDLISTGLSQINQCEFEKAVETFAELKTKFPSQIEGLLTSGMILESQMLFHDALGEYLKVIQSIPGNSTVHRLAGRCYARLNKLDRAVTEYRKALGSQGVNEGTMLELLDVLLDNWQIDEAGIFLDSSLVLGLSTEAADVIRARIAFHRGALSQADQLIGKVSAKSGNSLILSALFEYYKDRGLIDSAFSVGEKMLESENVTFADRQSYFLTALENSYLKDARSQLQEMASLDKSGKLLSAMETLYYLAAEDGYHADSANIVLRSLNPDRMSPILYEIRTQWLKSDLETALSDVDLAKLLVQKQEYVPEYRDFIKSEIELTSLILGDIPGVGEELWQTRGFKDGEREYVFAGRLNRRGASFVKDFSACLDTLLRQHRSEPLWMLSTGDVFANRMVRQPDTAATYYSKALELDSGFVPALENWAKMYQWMRRYDDVVKVLQDHSYLTDRYPRVRILLAENLVRTGKVTEGTTLFKSAIQDVKGDISQFERMAIETRRHSGTGSVREMIDLGIELNSNNEDMYLLAARFASEEKDWSRCREVTQKGLDLAEDNGTLQAISARVQFVSGDTEGATTRFDKLIKQYKGNPDVLMYYGLTLAEAGLNKRNAANMGRQALFFSGGSLASLLSLSQVYYLQNNFKSSRGEALRASRGHPDSPKAFFYLGRAYVKTAHPDAAKALNRSLELGLWGEMKTEAEQMLAGLQ